MKAINRIFTILICISLTFGVFVIVSSKNENPVSIEVRKSLESAEKENASLSQQTAQSADDSVSEGKAAATDCGSVTAIGDSVMLGAENALTDSIAGIYVDAKESRQVKAATEIVETLKSRNKLGDKVVIALGTNGPFSKETGQSLIDSIGSGRKIFWVLSYGVDWQDDVNDRIKSLAKENKNVTIIDWPSYAKGHSDWFYGDGIHLKPEGQKGYAEMIKDAISN